MTKLLPKKKVRNKEQPRLQQLLTQPDHPEIQSQRQEATSIQSPASILENSGRHLRIAFVLKTI